MSNFRTPPPPFLTVRMGPNWHDPPSTGRRSLGYRLPHSAPTPIPFGILAANRLNLVDVSLIYYARATHNSL